MAKNPNQKQKQKQANSSNTPNRGRAKTRAKTGSTKPESLLLFSNTFHHLLVSMKDLLSVQLVQRAFFGSVREVSEVSLGLRVPLLSF